jgi:hypothetical protein
MNGRGVWRRIGRRDAESTERTAGDRERPASGGAWNPEAGTLNPQTAVWRP